MWPFNGKTHRRSPISLSFLRTDLQSMLEIAGAETIYAMGEAFPEIFKANFIVTLNTKINHCIDRFMESKVEPAIDGYLNDIDIEREVIIPLSVKLETAVKQSGNEGAEKVRQIVSSQVQAAIARRFDDVDHGAVIADALLSALQPSQKGRV